MAEESSVTSGRLHGPIVGTWHLLDTAADEITVPAHRMDLRFLAEPQLRAVILSRVSGEEMPLIHWALFDGEVLRLQMVAPPERNQTEMPVLEMHAAGDKFQGHWRQQDVAIGPGLKLIRAHGTGS